MAAIDVSKYAHSSIHKAIITKDYAALRRIISSLPQLCDPSDIHTDSVSLSEESKADLISATIDRRDVPNRDTPLHLSVKLGDQTAAEILMQAGSDWSLQNEQGWSALQEAICNRQEEIARIIFRHYQPLAWAKWCRRLPRLIGTMRRMRNFYMEISFHFESSVIPFISRIAPSDTYRIWKRGANLRADTSLSGFDGFKIQRSEQSFLFLGDGSEDGKVPHASLCVLAHRDKEVMNALDGAGTPAGEAEVHREVRAMSQTNMFRPGIDVTQAVLLPQTSTWRKQEKTEMVGVWKAKVYDMHNVVFSLKSRRVPGAMSDDEFFNSCSRDEAESDFGDVLNEEERKQLEFALKMDAEENGDNVIAHRHSCYEEGNIPICDGEMMKVERKGRFSGWRRWEKTRGEKKIATSRSSLCVEEKGDIFGEEESSRRQGRRNGHQRRETKGSSVSGKDKSHENEYTKGLRPTLWLSQDFPLCTEELLPLLDILANKVKAIRRLRELLTTKLPKGTFPVKVATPVVPTIRVIVTFTKFEELQPLEEFKTPPSSPTAAVGTEAQPSSSSWFQWIKSTNQHPNTSTNNRSEDIQDPFTIPSDYTWITSEEKKKKLQEKSKSGKTKGQKKS